jgi:hypothetical protein
MRRTALSVGVALALLVANAAHAQTPAASDDEAHALFEAGQLAYASGRFDDALADFVGAYDLSHRADLLYNIGQCHDYLRHDRDALTAFEGYLAAVPDAPTRAVVEARVAVLRAAVAAATPAVAPELPTPTTEVTSSTTPELPAPAATAHLEVQGPAGYTLLRHDDTATTERDDFFVCTVPCEVDVAPGPARLAVATSDRPRDRHGLDHDRLQLDGRLRLTLTRVDRADQRTAGGWTIGLGLGASVLLGVLGATLGGQGSIPLLPAAAITVVASVITGLVLVFGNDTFDVQYVRF